MMAMLVDTLGLLAQTEGGGRGENPSELGGILIIVGAIVLAVLAIGSGWYLLGRATVRKRVKRDRD